MARSYRRGWPILAPAAIIVIVMCIAWILATRPIAFYDASNYALDARRVSQAQSLSALMGRSPRAGEYQFANHNHGATYQYYLAASLQYAGDPVQDFPLRVAVEMLGVHVFVVVFGLALSLSSTAAMLAVPMLMCYRGFGWLMGGYSRDFYRMLPLLVLFGLYGDPQDRPGLNLRGLLALAAMCFLWNAHTSSLMVAPLAVGCVLVGSKTLKEALATVGLFVLSIPLGGWRLVRATLETGSPIGYSPFHNVNYKGSAVVSHWWQQRGGLPVGWQYIPDRFSWQLARDGAFFVLLLWGALALMAVWVVLRVAQRSRRAWPPKLILMVALFLLISHLLLAGMADCISGRISTALSMNFRYRSHFYPLAAVLIGYLLTLLAQWLSAERQLRAATILSVLLACVAVQTVWPDLPKVPSFKALRLDAYESRKLLAESPAFRWLDTFRRMPPDQLIVMDYAYLGWYHSDNRIMFTQDPRLRPAFTADTPAEALKALDDLGVRCVYLIDLEAKAILNSGIPLGKVLESDAFKMVAREEGRWYLYRRSGADHDVNDAPARGS